MEPKLKKKKKLTLFLTPEHILKLHKVYVTKSKLAPFFFQQKALNTTFLETRNFCALFRITRNKSAFLPKNQTMVVNLTPR
jgi:hypothetical protein